MSILNKSLLCPNCASHVIFKSRRKGLIEKVLHTFFRKPVALRSLR
jgi:hypothetical protein